MKIEAGKFYKTAFGLKAKVIEVDEEYGEAYGWISDIYPFDPLRKPNRWFLDGANLIPEDRIIEPWIEPDPDLDFDWLSIPSWMKFIAMDSGGDWFAYYEAPKHGIATWRDQGGEVFFIPSRYAPKNYTGDWKDSLRENPNPRK